MYRSFLCVVLFFFGKSLTALQYIRDFNVSNPSWDKMQQYVMISRVFLF